MSRRQRTRGLLDRVRNYLKALVADRTYLTKEALAEMFGVREHEMKDVLDVLHREGLIDGPLHEQCVGGGRKEMWARDSYTVYNGPS